MHLLELTLDPDQGTTVELHPLFTVVQGLGERERRRLVRAVTSLVRGEDPGVPGVIESHGVVLPLDTKALEALDLHGDEIDPLVLRRQLPGAIAGDDEPDPSAAGHEHRELVEPDVADDVETLLASVPDGDLPALERLRRHHAESLEAEAVFRDAVERTEAMLEDARSRRRRAAQALEEAVRAAESAMEHEHSDGQAAAEAAQLQEAIAAVEAGIAELEALDVGPVRAALEALAAEAHADPDAEPTPSTRAIELADRFVELHAEVAALEERLEAEGRGPESALRRLDRARAEAEAAAAALDRTPLEPEDEEALRHAHEEVLEAERKASGLRSRSGQKKLAAALHRQQEILDRVGYPTWSAYVMGASRGAATKHPQARLDEADRELVAAEAAWAEISAALEADPDHHALLDALEALELEAVGLLLRHGAAVPDERDDLEPALRALREPVPGSDRDHMVAELHDRLSALGLELPSDDEALVVAAAEALLEEVASVPERLEELSNERRRLEGRLVQAHSRSEAEAWEALEAAVNLPEPDGDGSGTDTLEAELSAARAAEEEVLEVLEARRALRDASAFTAAVAFRRLRQAVAELAGEEPSEAVEATDEVGADGTPTASGPGWIETDPEAIEFYLLARLAAQREVSYAGSVPLVIDDALAGVGEADVRQILHGLGRMAESVQIVYLSDDPVVVSWAAEQGAERAAVVTSGALV